MDILTDSRRVRRLEVVETGRRRRWSDAEKLRIVEESFSGPRLVSATARHHGISNQLLFSWRKASMVMLAFAMMAVIRHRANPPSPKKTKCRAAAKTKASPH